MNKKNVFRLLAILMVAVVSVGFVSCGDDDDDKKIVDPPVQKDGLEGYWLENVNAITDGSGNNYDNLRFFFLDGEGGGYYYYYDFSPYPYNDVSKQYMEQDIWGNTGVYTKSIGTFKNGAGKTYTLYVNKNFTAPTPLTYTLTGSTLKATGPFSRSLMFNVIGGSISGCTKVTKVE